MIRIGTTPAGKPFTLPNDAVTHTAAILAKKGAGKTYTAGVIEEEFAKAAFPFVVLDPVGVHWGIRSTADGKRAWPYAKGIVVFGGEHGDMPLNRDMGADLARAIVADNFTAIIDLTELSKTAWREFVRDFCRTLYQQNRTPRALFIEEAAEFIPQTRRPEMQEAYEAVERIVRVGRNRGLGAFLISQRSAQVAKDVLTQIDVLVALRTVGIQDRNAVLSMFETVLEDNQQRQLAEFKRDIVKIPNGTAWVWWPERSTFVQVKIRTRETYHAGATPTFGAAATVVQAHPDVDALRSRFAALVKQREGEDPKKLQARIRELERELAAKPGDDGRTISNLESRIGFIEEEADTLRRAVGQALEVFGAVKVGSDNATRVLEGAIAEHAARARSRHTKGAGTTTVTPPRIVDSVRQPAVRSMNGTSAMPPPDLDGITGGALRMLQRLAERHPETWTKAQLATLAHVKKSGGSFGTYISRLTTKGLIVADGGRYAITEAGLDAIGGAPPSPLTRDELIAQWRGKLSGGGLRMFDALLAAGEAGLARDELAERAAIALTGGSFGTYLSRLTTNGLAVRDGDRIVATDLVLGG